MGRINPYIKVVRLDIQPREKEKMNSAYAFLALQMLGPVLNAIWKDTYFEAVKGKIESGLRAAADLTKFTEADDILIEDIIDSINDKKHQDAILDIIEDAVEGRSLKKFIEPVTEFLREKLNIPDND